MDIYAVRTVIANAARTVVLPAGALTCTPYLPDSVSEPHFFVADYTIDYDRVMGRAMDEVEFTARVLVSRADEQSGQKLCDAMFSGSGAASLKAAIESVRGTGTLSAVAHDLRVTRMQGNRWYEHAGVHYVGGELTIRVIGSGS